MRWKEHSRKEELAMGYVDMQIVPRSEWGALPPKNTDPITNHPIADVFITYHTETMACNTREECCEILRELQARHMDQGMDDIAYNFLAGGDGHVYEGRGWHARPDKSLKFNPEFYQNRMDFAYIGDWRHKIIPEVYYVEAMYTWGHRGIKKGYLTNLYENTDIREKGREVWDMVAEVETDDDMEEPIRSDLTANKLTDPKECDLDYGELAGPGGFVDVQGPDKSAHEPMVGDGIDVSKIAKRDTMKDKPFFIGSDWF